MEISRLETYIAVMKVLYKGDPITKKQIIRKSNLNLKVAKKSLNFLIKSDLIIEKTLGNKTVYSITDKGQKVVNYFRVKDEDSIFGGSNITRID